MILAFSISLTIWFILKFQLFNIMKKTEKEVTVFSQKIDDISEKLKSGNLTVEFIEKIEAELEESEKNINITQSNELTTFLKSFYMVYKMLLNELKTIVNYSFTLEGKVRERTESLERVQDALVKQAHKAGMAEIASSTLHNVGNAFNSILIKFETLNRHFNEYKIFEKTFQKISNLLKENLNNIDNYLTNDEKGKKIIPILDTTIEEMKKRVETDRAYLNHDIINSINHILTLIALQNNYTKNYNMIDETFSITECLDDALNMFSESLSKRGIKVIKEYNANPKIRFIKNNFMQIIINIIKNSIESIDMEKNNFGQNKEYFLKIITEKRRNYAIVKFKDNGNGIKPEILKKIFSFRFSTKERGSGFGLHYSANILNKAGGKILALSKGENQGATIIIIIPIKGGENEL